MLEGVPTLAQGRTATAATPPVPAAPPSLVPLLAVGAGVAVADNYYLQPLLALVGADLGIGVGVLGGVSALALLGYALGLLLVVPLGDLVDRRPLVTGVLGLTTTALLAMTLAPSAAVLAVAAFAVGLTSVVAQVLVPYAVSLASDVSRGRVAGTMMSGVLGGILAARVVASLAGGALGWRAVYGGAAGLTATLLVVLWRRLPAETERHRRNGRQDVPYRQVLAGVVRLAREEPVLRVRAGYGFCGFAVFSSIWTTVAFHLRDGFGLDVTAVAGVAVLGLAGVLAAPRAGALADRGHATAVTGASYAALLVGTLVLAQGSSSFFLLLLGIALCDVALNSGHVANLGVIYRLLPDARSRATTVYMTTLFLGGASGSLLAAVAYGAAGWTGTAAVCSGFAGVAVLSWLARLPVRAPEVLDEPFPEAVA
jgi:predicted MFS family arabinose efflux permease